MSKQELNPIKINERGVDYTFFEMEFLPSGGKQYNYSNDEKKVYFRPMRIGEAKAISKIISSDTEPKISELLRVYRHCIRGVDVNSLCEMDFVAVMTVINFYTQTKAGWNITQPCPYNGCDGVVEQFITMFDLDFTEPKYDSLPITITTEEGQILEFTLPSMSKLEEWEHVSESEENAEIDKTIMSYTPMLMSVNNAELRTIMDAYDILYNLSPEDYSKLMEIDDLINIDMNPIKLKCPKCSKEFNFEFSLTYQKAIPLL